MKKAILYLLMFSYACTVLKPVLPTISDIMAHIFWYSEHIATVHQEHGKYHVHLEYTDAAKKGYPEKDTQLSKSASGDEHLMTAQIYSFNTPALIPTIFFSFPCSLPQIFEGNDVPPPKA